jgi:exopolyphosphatase/guanosine-5'-triphosphate,3'-diphosphate pyrophosphatase
MDNETMKEGKRVRQEGNRPAEDGQNQLFSTSCFASIDIGSHTTRLLIAGKDGAQLVPVRTERRVTRLAQNFYDGAIPEEAQRVNILALKEYVRLLEKFRVGGMACGATGVVRRAKNSDAVLDRISEETGIECKILSEETEALLSAKGVLSVMSEKPEDLLIFDVGGGSTEFVLSGPQNSIRSTSRPIGAATLTEAFFKEDPPSVEALKRAALLVENEIIAAGTQLYKKLKKNGIVNFFSEFQLIGTAGTVTTLAAMNIKMERYSAYRVNGVVLDKHWLSHTIESLALMCAAERKLIVGLEPGREDIILGGAVIVLKILSCFGHDSFVVCDAGLLEGLLIDLVEQQCAGSGGESASGLRTRLTWRLQRG